MRSWKMLHEVAISTIFTPLHSSPTPNTITITNILIITLSSKHKIRSSYTLSLSQEYTNSRSMLKSGVEICLFRIHTTYPFLPFHSH